MQSLSSLSALFQFNSHQKGVYAAVWHLNLNLLPGDTSDCLALQDSRAYAYGPTQNCVTEFFKNYFPKGLASNSLNRGAH